MGIYLGWTYEGWNLTVLLRLTKFNIFRTPKIPSMAIINMVMMLISKITMMLRFQCLWFGVAILSSFDALSPRLCHQNRKIIRQSLQLYTVHSLLNIKYILHIITKSFSLTWPNVCRWWNQLVPFRKGHSCSHAKIWSFFNDRTTNRSSVRVGSH